MDATDVPSFKMAKFKDGKLSEYVQVPITEVLEADDTFVNEDGNKVIKYEGWKKIAAHCGIVPSKMYPPALLTQPTEDNKQQHVFQICLEYWECPDVYDIAVGEASKLNTGDFMAKDGKKVYSEVGHIDAEFRASMAYMRAYVRAMKSLVKLDGVFGDVEAPDFGSGAVDYKNL